MSRPHRDEWRWIGQLLDYVRIGRITRVLLRPPPGRRVSADDCELGLPLRYGGRKPRWRVCMQRSRNGIKDDERVAHAREELSRGKSALSSAKKAIERSMEMIKKADELLHPAHGDGRKTKSPK